MKKTHRVTKRFGEYQKGTLVSDSDPFIRRKLAEGGCLEEIKNKGGAPENKAVKGAPENKAGGKA